MNCRRVSSLMSAYIDGELTGDEMLEIRRHMHDCGSCMLQYESLRQMKQMLFRLPYAVPRAGFLDEMVARLDTIETPYYQRLYHRIWSYGRAHVTPVAAGCAALGAVFFFLVSNPGGSHEQIAFNYPAYNQSSMIMPPAHMATEVDYPIRHDNAQPLIPRQTGETKMGTATISLVSFEGY